MSTESTPKTLGLRHLALNVRDAQISKTFYQKTLKMKVVWEPDPKSVYLSSANSSDNLALHQADAPLHKPGHLNHLGFFVPAAEDVDKWYTHVQNCGVKILREIKTHRDQARSFYVEDPDGIVIQILFHP